MPVLSYVPQFIEQQYVPTADVGLLSNILGQKQQQYNQAAQMQAAALSDIYGKETTSGFEPAAQERIKGFEQKLQELTDKRGGDLGAAIGDIIGAIGSMYKDPFWKTSKKALEQSKILQEQLARNPQLRVLSDPRSVAYREGLTDEDLAYKVFDPALVTATVGDLYGDIAKQVRESGLIPDEKTGYLQAITTKGATEAEVEQMKQNPEVRRAILSRLNIDPYLANNPELSAEVNNLIDKGIENLNQGYTRQFVRPILETGSGIRHIPINEGGNIGLLRDRPFKSIDELNNIPKDDPRFLIGERIKSNAFNNLPKLDKDLMNSMGGYDAIRDIAEVTSSLPSPGSALKKVVSDAGSLLKAATSTVGALTSGAAISNLPTTGVKLMNASDIWSKVREIEPPLEAYLERKNEIYAKYGLDKLDKESREKVLRNASNINNKINNSINENLQKNYGDVMGKFYIQDFVTGDMKTNEAVEKIYNNLNKRVETIPFNNFSIINTDSDLDYKNQDRLKRRGNEDYLYSTGKGHYRILETHVDPELGPIYLLETDKKGGGVEHHLATLTNPNFNRQLLSTYGKNNIPSFTDQAGNVYATDLSSNYETFINNERLKTKYKNSLTNLPGYKEFEGGTIEDYLEQLRNFGVTANEAKDIIDFINIVDVPTNTKLK